MASLNDKNETKYATDLYKDVVGELIEESAADEQAVLFLRGVLEFVKEEPESPTHGTSKFFVTCFSADENDLSQWRLYGKKNGYAIGFRARGLFRDATSQLYKVIYDREKQRTGAKKIAEATLRFFREGLVGDRVDDPAGWAKMFFEAWDEWVYKLAPLAKDKYWKAENEFRLVHELKVSEFPRVRFAQKDTVLARYLPLDTPSWYKLRTSQLPIAKVWIGPGERQSFTRISVSLLLQQMGYANVPIEVSKIPFTQP